MYSCLSAYRFLILRETVLSNNDVGWGKSVLYSQKHPDRMLGAPNFIFSDYKGVLPNG